MSDGRLLDDTLRPLSSEGWIAFEVLLLPGQAEQLEAVAKRMALSPEALLRLIVREWLGAQLR